MDAEALLSDLLEVSGQVEAAAIVTRDGAPVATTLSGEQASAFAEAVHQLSASASAAASPTDEHLVQLQVTLEESCVFLAQDGEHAVGCVTVSHPTAGLVFYDLKTTLRRLAGDHDDLVPKPRAWDGSEEKAGEGSA
ncbi:MAG: roadblock/LC7 domain-containing protein [Gaiellaceae bacterium]